MSGSSEWVKISCLIPGSLWPVWEAAKDKAERMGIEHPVEVIHNGMVLEYSIADFLATEYGEERR